MFFYIFWLRIARKNTDVEGHFYKSTNLFLKYINKNIIYSGSNNSDSRTFCDDVQFYTEVSPPVCSKLYILM